MLDRVGPFLKWPGGKGRLIPQLDSLFPKSFSRYVEPFVGGGAVFLHLSQTRDLKSSVICDVNADLMNVWSVVKSDSSGLCRSLKRLVDEYLGLPSEARASYYYEMRSLFNDRSVGTACDVDRAAVVIFLNKTCYNGLYRVNSKGAFNSPFGRYDRQRFFTEWSIETISRLLANTRIIVGDFEMCGRYVTRDTFVYFDPPYRPLSKTSNFTAFDKRGFADSDQERLAEFFKKLDKKGSKVMLSNADTLDGYFERLYSGYNIRRVWSCRSINADSSGRGKISELVITNY